MKVFAKLCMIGILAFAVLQFVRPSIPVGPGTAELQVPPAVKSILEKDCYSCHSSQRRLAWFDQIGQHIGWCDTTCLPHASASISQR
jgi:hypothetical protein